MPSIQGFRCAAAPLAIAFGALAATAVAMPPFGAWSMPERMDSLPGSSAALLTPAVDGCASHSPDGLTIAFNSNRPAALGGSGNHDLFIATRTSRSQGFGPPQPLTALNTSADEFCPTIARGNRLYFSRTSPGDLGDIFVSRKGPNGWTGATRLGSNVNVHGPMEEAAAFYEDDDGREVTLFSRRSGTEPGVILESVAGAPSFPVAGGPHSPSAADNRPSITHDGRTIFYDSNRGGGAPDLYYSTRSSASGTFGEAVRLSALSVAGGVFDARPFISWDGTFLTFSSNRVGSKAVPGAPAIAPDIWFATRPMDTGN